VNAASRYGSTVQAQSVLDAMVRKAERFKERVLLGKQMAESRAAFRARTTGTGLSGMSADEEGSARGSPRARTAYSSAGGGSLSLGALGSTFDIDA